MYIWIIVIGAQLAAGISMALLFLAYRSPRLAKYRIADDPHRSVDEKQTYKDAALNALVSVGLIILIVALFGNKLVYSEPAPWWMFLIEGVVALLVYDFAYYFMHRYPFHEWKLLRDQHAVHHAARNPTAIDSLLLHPIETAAGLLLFFGSIALVGGVHLITFAALFFGYTVLNVFNHAGLNIPRGPLRVVGVLSVKHDRHHHSMLSGNYASITPLPDIVFGTVE